MKDKIAVTLDTDLVQKINKIVKKRHSNFSATVNTLLWQAFDVDRPEFLGGNVDRKKLADEIIGRLREQGTEVNL